MFGSSIISSKVLLLVILGSMLIMTVGTLVYGQKGSTKVASDSPPPAPENRIEGLDEGNAMELGETAD